MGNHIMPSIIRATTTNGLQVAPDNSGSLALQTNGTTTALTIDTSQNVGIGTTSPTAKLDSYGTKGRIKLDPDNATVNVPQITFATQDNSNFADGVLAALNIRMNTSGSERMRIDSSGNLLVNTTSSSQSSKGLKINSDGATGNFIYFGITGTGSYNNIAFFRGTDGSLSEVGKISTTGSATSYVTSSDYRLKENILPMTGALGKVLQLKPCTYTWKSDNSNGQGFIAHELADIVPDAVVGEKDEVDAEGNIKPQGVDTSFLVATLTAAIQEMKAIIDAQSVTINDLKARIETLEAK